MHSDGGDEAVVDPEVLLEYLLQEEEEGDLLEYLTAFLGDHAMGFGVELIERRRTMLCGSTS